MTRLAVGVAIAVALALTAVASAGAQGPDVQIESLACNSDPELLVIENVGDAAQDFAGWKAESEPPGTESFDLSTLGSLPAGGSVTVQSGPSATGIFLWSLDEIFRDDDSTDFARIIDDTGAVVDQVNCAAGATPTPSPSPAPSPADIPNGGGPPSTGGALSSTMMVLIGGSIAAVGVATLALPRLRLRPSPAPRSPVQRVGQDDSGRRPSSATFGLVVAALATLVFLLLRRHRA